jgi:DNA repair protein RadC
MVYQIVSERRADPYRISCPSDAFKIFERYSKARTERFVVATLNGAHDVIRVHLVTIGLVSRTVVHPREVLITAIKDNAVAYIACHNHPSGHLDPSPEDREITNRLHDASEIIGISMLDHVIVGPHGGWFSFVEHGLLEPPRPD